VARVLQTVLEADAPFLGEHLSNCLLDLSVPGVMPGDFGVLGTGGGLVGGRWVGGWAGGSRYLGLCFKLSGGEMP
jgi:hypothetical protein